jgi:hypothetical protein
MHIGMLMVADEAVVDTCPSCSLTPKRWAQWRSFKQIDGRAKLKENMISVPIQAKVKDQLPVLKGLYKRQLFHLLFSN